MLDRIADDFVLIVQVQLALDVGDVGIDGIDADAQLRGHLGHRFAIRQALD